MTSGRDGCASHVDCVALPPKSQSGDDMRAIVIGGTGKVGREVVRALSEAGADAVPAARRVASGGIALDMADAASVAVVARGFDTAFLATPLGPDESDIGVAAVAALRSAGVAKIIYLGIMNLEEMRAIPHFETKIPVRDAVLSDGCGVMIAANFFFQNDAMVLPVLMGAGVYPLPVGSAGVWSVDVGDIGQAAANAMLHDDWNGQSVPLCGAEALTGPSMAATWTDVMGRPVVYGGDAIDPFLGMLAQHIPGWGEWEANDFRLMMEVTQAKGCPATPAEVAAAATIIGRPQRRYRDFVAEMVQAGMAIHK